MTEEPRFKTPQGYWRLRLLWALCNDKRPDLSAGELCEAAVRGSITVAIGNNAAEAAHVALRNACLNGLIYCLDDRRVMKWQKRYEVTMKGRHFYAANAVTLEAIEAAARKARQA